MFNEGVGNADFRMTMERAKRAAQVDFSYTCFKGKCHVKVGDICKLMWLADELKQEEYM